MLISLLRSLCYAYVPLPIENVAQVEKGGEGSGPSPPTLLELWVPQRSSHSPILHGHIHITPLLLLFECRSRLGSTIVA